MAARMSETTLDDNRQKEDLDMLFNSSYPLKAIKQL
jgi:hypothetical protein